MKPTTAVIFAAGIGTRMFPVTSAVQKELLPIGNRPVVDYVVSDLVTAGVSRIIFVIRPGQTGLKDYYLGNEDIKSKLESLGKLEAIAQLSAIHSQAKFEFVEQPESAGYGTAIPLQIAMPLLNLSEPVIVCGGDDFVWHAGDTCETARFIDTFVKAGSDGAIMSLELPASKLSSYGVLNTKSEGGYEFLQDIIEKPTSFTSKTGLANISKYILNKPLLEYVAKVLPRTQPKESFITDAITAGAKDHSLVVHRVTGEYLDTGSLPNWRHANEVIASSSN